MTDTKTIDEADALLAAFARACRQQEGQDREFREAVALVRAYLRRCGYIEQLAAGARLT